MSTFPLVLTSFIRVYDGICSHLPLEVDWMKKFPPRFKYLKTWSPGGLLFWQVMNSFRRSGFDDGTTSLEVGSRSHGFGPNSSSVFLLLVCRRRSAFQLPNVATGCHVSLTIM